MKVISSILAVLLCINIATAQIPKTASPASDGRGIR